MRDIAKAYIGGVGAAAESVDDGPNLGQGRVATGLVFNRRYGLHFERRRQLEN